MTKTESLEIVSIQFALFFRDVVPRPDEEFADINAKMSGVFDSIKTVIPVPPEMPAEIPLVTEKSTDDRYQVTIARSRIDLHVKRTAPGTTNAEILRDFNLKVREFTNYVLDKRSVVRFGMIAKFFYDSAQPVDCIRRKYFRDSIGDVNELSLRFNRQSKARSLTINDVIEISGATAVRGGVSTQGLLVQRDINNALAKGRLIEKSDLEDLSKTYADYFSDSRISELLV